MSRSHNFYYCYKCDKVVSSIETYLVEISSLEIRLHSKCRDAVFNLLELPLIFARRAFKKAPLSLKRKMLSKYGRSNLKTRFKEQT